MRRLSWATCVISANVFVMTCLSASGESGAVHDEGGQQKERLAEELVAQKEAAAGRPLDSGYRARLKNHLASTLSVQQLEEAAVDGLQAVSPAAIGDSRADLVYTPLTPCRVVDTRLDALGAITGGFGRFFWVAGTTGFPDQGGTSGGCGVPLGSAAAVMINFAAVTPTGPGNLRTFAYAEPTPPLPTASTVNFGVVPGLNAIANGLAVPICDSLSTTCTFDLIIFASTTTHVVADVVGYFAPPAP